MDDKLEQLRNEYDEISIPEELDFVVKSSIQQSLKARRRRKSTYKWLASAGAVALIFFIAINASATVASAFAAIPGVDRIIQVLTFKEYIVKETNYDAHVKVPVVTDMNNKDLELGLNHKYMAENKALFDKFQAEMNDLKKAGGGHLGLDTGYEVKTDNDRIFSIERYVEETAGSSATTVTLDTIDKKEQILLSLPMLFKDSTYIQQISENIQDQMKSQMKVDKNKVYWVHGRGEELTTDEFKSITKDQSFYINKEGKLVIVFNQYDVAPGYMGVVEFVIPTEIIADDLVSSKYIQ
ncbi:anti-sigma-V factor RsiV [Paenibacillus pini]|uniref:Anti-sigma factor homolog YrhM n=1 Tax=Paenibacillus pini JCM 16418 TaxID=1236976 RepID=W7Z4K2_9BACL|nr:RsiV family protein [Paenibacillus pini]GAF09294.1 anti-sigma factor homolog YrhM [Paenibacillus pini JCM 16418]